MPTQAVYDFAGATALVTGAGGDIGRTTAVRLAGSGANVVVTDIDRAAEGLERTRLACAATAAEEHVLAVTADVTDPTSVAGCFDAAAQRFGVPELVFNNAGVQGELLPLQDYPLEDFPFVMTVNVVGVFNVLREAARRLREAGRAGAIVNSASMAGVEGAANMPAYSASKGAVMSLTRSASKDLAPLGIRVNAISPAFIGEGLMWDRQVQRQALANTQYYSTDPEVVAAEMVGAVPIRRTGTLDEVAATVLWLLSDESSYVTGHNIIVSGGI
jgi:NAD(P)-dependent dehydrogenase (short-subunit alcohol dehydrogenase family)